MSITGCRNDAFVKMLNGIGYQPVLMPRTGVVPPELYVYNNEKLVRRGPLADYLPAGVVIPTPQQGHLSSIEHHETSKKSLSMAANFLGDALKWHRNYVRPETRSFLYERPRHHLQI